MTTSSSSRSKSVPQKLKNYFTEQDEEYFSSQETDDVFVSRKSGNNKGTEKEDAFNRTIV